MKGKNLKLGQHAKSMEIRIEGKRLDSTSLINSIVANFDLRAIHNASKTLKFAVNHLKDKGRLKYYSKLISEKWNVPETQIIDEINLVKFIVLIPLLNNLYYKETQKKDIASELNAIHDLIKQLESGPFTLEIKLKATINSIPKDVQIKSDFLVTRIFKFLNSLPKVEISQTEKRKRGHPQGSILEIQNKKKCAKELYNRYSNSIEGKNNICEFIGYIFIGAGIFEDEKTFNQAKHISEFRESLLSKVKALLK